MIPNERKEMICKKYFNIIELIYKIGNGLFFRKDLFQFSNKFYCYSKSDFVNALEDLENAEIIERIRIGRATIIKLKKYALRYITGNKRDSMSSITVNGNRIVKLAFLTQVIWEWYGKEEITFMDMVMDINKYSSFLLKEREGHLFLNKFSYLVDTEDMEIYKNEVEALRKSYSNALSNLNKKNNGANNFKLASNEETIVKEFNANNLLKINYFVYDMEEVFIIYVMDYRRNIFVDRYLNFINEAYTYFFRKFKKPIKFITVGNDGNNRFIVDDYILEEYLIKNDLEFAWREGNLMLSSKYVHTNIKNNIDYTSIKGDIILTKVS
ncbi:hypothetical protein [Clostridium tagluense]|uniref:hypothetical protein n=1 Tax=Clostridium tagluense TaxID=360422 RepID=UPI001C0C66D6|nr:hypothetical protein [Clostridium tagluense]MBU3129081.1 hypothetical protein [Clostridium tagluense]